MDQAASPPSPDDPGVLAWAALLRTHATVLAVLEREVAEEASLPWARYDVLLELAAGPDEGLQMQQVSDRVVLSRTRVSRLVAAMANDGLVEQRPDPEDGRATRVQLTRSGRRALRQAAPIYLAGIREHFSRHLTATQTKAIHRGLHRVLDAHDQPR